jgi:hypothetical protein
VITPAGLVVAQENVIVGTEAQLRVSGLAAGAYILRLESAGHTHFTTLLEQ